MRKIYLEVARLNLVNGDTVKIELLNSVGNPLTTNSAYSFSQDITIDSDVLELELLENTLIDSYSFYKLSISADIYFNFKLPHNDNNIPHELTSLLTIGCVKGVINMSQDVKKLDDDFVKKLEFYFTGENSHFTPTQREIVEIYEYYANNIIENNGLTIDVAEAIDMALSKTGAL